MALFKRLFGTTHKPSHFPDHLSRTPQIGKPMLASLSCPSPDHSWWGPSATSGSRVIFFAVGSRSSNPPGSWQHISSVTKSQLRWTPRSNAIPSLIRSGPWRRAGSLAIWSRTSWCLTMVDNEHDVRLPWSRSSERRRVTLALLRQCKCIKTSMNQRLRLYLIRTPCSAHSSLLIVFSFVMFLRW